MGPTLLAYYEPEDVLQDVWVSEQEDRHQRKRARPRREQLRWLYGVAHHRILRLHRDLQPRSRPRHSTSLPPSFCQPLPPGDGIPGEPRWETDRSVSKGWHGWEDPTQPSEPSLRGREQVIEPAPDPTTNRAAGGAAAFGSGADRSRFGSKNLQEPQEGCRGVLAPKALETGVVDGNWPHRRGLAVETNANPGVAGPNDLGERVRSEIHCLDPLSRVSFVLRGLHGLEWATVAWVMGRGAESLRKRHARSLQTLRTRLREAEEVP